MKVTPDILAFNQGEFSPYLTSRTDIAVYNKGCRKMRNFIPTVQGPVRRRPGTRFITEVNDSAKQTWLSKFQFSVSQAYVLEWGHKALRFFFNRGLVTFPPFNAITTPYNFEDLTTPQGTFALRMWQTGDVMYIVHSGGKYAPQKLSRLGPSSFIMTPVGFDDGPFNDINPGNGITVYATAATGAATITSSLPIFIPDIFNPLLLVGSLILIEQPVVDATKAWEVNKAIVIGDIRISDGKHYKALNAANTGTLKPVHSSDWRTAAKAARFDGDNGVEWQFQDAGYGWARILSIIDGSNANVGIISQLPAGVVGAGNPTPRWAFSKYNVRDGFPTNIGQFRERLWYFRFRDFDASVAGDFESFQARDDSGTVTAEMAISGTTISDTTDPVEWAQQSNQAFLVGTSSDEHAMFEANQSEPLGPGNVMIRKQSGYGSRSIKPLQVGEGLVYVQLTGRKVRDMKMAYAVQERWDSADLTVMAEHLTKGGIIDIAYQQEPDSIVWMVRADGLLLGFTFNREQDVKGWHPHRIGGAYNPDNTFAVVESIVTVPSPDLTHDDLYMIVKRSLSGTVKRYIEYVEKHFELNDDPMDAFYVDAGLTLNNTRAGDLLPGSGASNVGSMGVPFVSTVPGAFSAGDVNKYIHFSYPSRQKDSSIIWKLGVAQIASYFNSARVDCTILREFPKNFTSLPNGRWRVTVTTVTGLTHLEGQPVDVCADGVSMPGQIVTGGQIFLPKPASKVHIGLPCPAIVQPMPIDMMVAEGSSKGKVKRANKVNIRFFQTAAAKYGRDEDTVLDDVLTRSPDNFTDEAVPVFTGDKLVSWPDGYDRFALVTVVADSPLPCTVLSFTPQMSVQDD